MGFGAGGSPRAGKAGPRYEVRGEVGRGGVGVVFDAWDTVEQRQVALKTLGTRLLSNEVALKRFQREAEILAQLDHPHIVKVHRTDVLDGQIVLDMEFIHGRPLSELLRSGPLDPSDLVTLLRQVLDALAECHRKGIVHCDLKPGNILITPTGHAFISDFGIARIVLSDSAAAELSGPLWGTPCYCPPEVWEGERATAAWDVYAIGVMAYECLTGAPPFSGESPAAVMRQVLSSTPPPLSSLLPEVSQELSNLVARMLSREAAQRPADAVEAYQMLLQTPESVHCGEATATIRSRSGNTGVQRAGARKASGSPLRIALALCLFIVAIAGALAATQWGRDTSTPPKMEAGGEDPGAAPKDLITYRDTAFFSAYDPAHGRELWYTEPGMDAPILLKDLYPGPTSSNPHCFKFRGAQKELYFVATTPEEGEELWTANVLRTGGKLSFDVRCVKDIVPGPLGSAPALFEGDDKFLFFYAMTPGRGRELWITNGRSGQTAMVADILPGPGDSQFDLTSLTYVLCSEAFYFIAKCEKPVLHVYSLEDYAVHRMQALENNSWGGMALANGSLILRRSDSAHGGELWKWNKAAGQLEIVVDIWPGPASSDPDSFYTLAGLTYFHARTEAAGDELYVTDGTADGTRLVKDINPGPGDSHPYGYARIGDQVVFRANDGQHGVELWSSDGTEAGTRLVCDANPGPADGAPYNIVEAHRGAVFFTADDGVHGEELWTARPNGTHWDAGMIGDFYPGAKGSEPHHLCWYVGDSGLMVATTPDGGRDLCHIDGIDGKYVLSHRGQAKQ